jgi:hypothetical protein
MHIVLILLSQHYNTEGFLSVQSRLRTNLLHVLTQGYSIPDRSLDGEREKGMVSEF